MERRKGGSEGERGGGKGGESNEANLPQEPNLPRPAENFPNLKLWFGNTHKSKMRHQKDDHSFWRHKEQQEGGQAGSSGSYFLFLQRSARIFFPLRISWTLISGDLSVCQDLMDVQGRLSTLETKLTPGPCRRSTLARFLSCSRVRATCSSTLSSMWNNPSSQRSGTHLMNGGRGLRWERVLIALIARIQAFKMDETASLFICLCYSKW